MKKEIKKEDVRELSVKGLKFLAMYFMILLASIGLNSFGYRDLALYMTFPMFVAFLGMAFYMGQYAYYTFKFRDDK